MENSSNITTTTTGGPEQLSVSLTHQHQYPSPHDPTLVEFESLDSQNEQPMMMTTLSIQHSDHDSSILTERGETIAVSIGDEDRNIHLRLTENAVMSDDIENQIEFTATSMENPENDSSNHPPIATLIATTPRTALLHEYSNPKIATYFVGVYPSFLAYTQLKFIAAMYSPFDTHKSFMIISIVVYLMAILDLKILFCLYDRLKRPSNQHFSPGHYKILTHVYYILLTFAMLLVLPTLFTPQR